MNPGHISYEFSLESHYEEMKLNEDIVSGRRRASSGIKCVHILIQEIPEKEESLAEALCPVVGVHYFHHFYF